MKDGKKIKNIIYNLIENVFPKMPIILFLILLIFKRKYKVISIIIEDFFSVIENIGSSNFLTLSIGITGFSMTSISILGTGLSTPVKKIQEEGLTDKFIEIYMKAISSSILLLIMSLGINIYKTIFWKMLFLTVLFLAIFNFLRFGILIIKIYEYNIKNTDIIMDLENTSKNNIEILLEKISFKLCNIYKKLTEAQEEKIKRDAKLKELKEHDSRLNK